MGDVILAEGARGDLVRSLQECLAGQGYPSGALDGQYGFRTAAAVQTFQRDAGLPPTGETDVPTWAAITALKPPTLRDRVLQLTAAFEGRGFTLAKGNCDGCGITWGIIGFTLRAGEIQSILRDALALDRRLVQEAFGSDTDDLLRMLDAPVADQIVWADERSAGSYKVLLSEPWRTHFRVFGSQPEVQVLQLARIDADYFRPALRTAAAYGLRTELGVSLCFDIHVQSGGIEPDVAQELAVTLATCSSEIEKRLLIAASVAGGGRVEYGNDMRDRKLAIARGTGMVRGANYRLRNWGIDESAAVM